MNLFINIFPLILFVIFIIFLLWSQKKGKGGIFSKKMEEIIDYQHKKIIEEKEQADKKNNQSSSN